MISTAGIAAEFLGTFLLVLSVFASGGNAYVVGITLAVIIALIGELSGGHVNPAISVAMYMKGSLDLTEFLIYSAAQMLGGISCFFVYRAVA